MNVKEDYMMPGQITIEQILSPDTWSGKMSQEPLVRESQRAEISESSLKKPQKLQTKMPMFLDLRGESGVRADAYWETDGLSLGAYMMHNTGEFHKDENAYVYWLISTETPQERYCLNCSEKPLQVIPSKLSWILEQNPDPKYNLSAKACQGILRRAEKRGKELPKILKDALERQATPLRSEGGAEFDRYGKRAGKGALVQTELSGTLGVSQDQTLIAFEPGAMSRVGGHTYEDVAGTVRANAGDNQQAVVYGIGSYDSNAMKSDNPHSGIYKADTSRTLDLNGGNPGCNQGGMAVVCIEGNGQRESHKGDGYKESDTMYTLNTVEQHAVCIENHPADSRVKIEENGICQTLSSRMETGGGNVPMVMEEPLSIGHDIRSARFTDDGITDPLTATDYKDPIKITYQKVTGTVDCGLTKYTCNQLASQDMFVANRSIVRRLTPLEAERLQGFPDNWTNIGDWVDSKGKTHKGESDSPRYKALGNSIALPYWSWMAERMMPYLPENPTMASLFDGIGGFPLVFSRCGCKPVLASEIEEFPIAVTKIRFPEEG